MARRASPDPAPGSRRHDWAFCAVWGVLLAGLCVVRAGGLQLQYASDSYQYLSTATNFAEGRFGQTSIVYYDEERLHGLIPAPLTTFPLGYPMLLAAATYVFGRLDRAAFFVSLLSSLGTLLAMVPLAREARLTSTMQRLALGAFALICFTAMFGSYAVSEPPFTLAVTLAELSVLRSLRTDASLRRSVAMAALAGALLALAYWVRYAGLFFLAALVPIAVCGLARFRRACWSALTALVVAAPAVALAMFRNARLVHSWRGGNLKHVPHSIGEIVRGTAMSVRDLLLSPTAVRDLVLVKVALVLALAALIVTGAVVAWRKRPAGAGITSLLEMGPLTVLGAFCATYVAGILYAAKVTAIDFNSRLFLPILPTAFILLFGLAGRVEAALEPHRGKTWGIACAAALLLFGIVHAHATVRVPSLRARYLAITDALEQPADGERTALAIIAEHAGPSGAVMTTEGQATGWALKRRTLALPTLAHSSTEWTEQNVLAALRRFDVKILIVHKVVYGSREEVYPSPFVVDLAAGHAPGSLRKVGESPSVVLYAPHP